MGSASTMRERAADPYLRQEAFLMLEGKGAVLATAREVSALIRDAGLSAAVIGGVAVALHGHVRTTIDVDILVEGPLDAIAELLNTHGFEFEAGRREFLKNGVPVHLVSFEQTGASLGEIITIDEVTTVTLAALIEMKLRSGTKSVLRAQDLADVIGLIRVHQLTAAFVRNLDRTLHPVFLGLDCAIEHEVGDRRLGDWTLSSSGVGTYWAGMAGLIR